MKRLVVYLVGGCALVVASVLIFLGLINELPGEGSPPPPDMTTWQTYESDRLHLAFQYPPEATIDTVRSIVADGTKGVRVDLTRSTNEEGQRTDGFTFCAWAVKKAPQEPFGKAARRVYRTVAQRNDVMHPLRRDTLRWNHEDRRRSYYFDIRSESGDQLRYEIVEGGEDGLFVTSGDVDFTDEQERNYIQVIDGMIQRLTSPSQTTEASSGERTGNTPAS